MFCAGFVRISSPLKPNSEIEIKDLNLGEKKSSYRCVIQCNKVRMKFEM